MKDLFNVLLITAVALGAAAVAVKLGDARTAVPPPGSIVEQFARHIAARRYDRAMRHVDARSGITLTTVRLAGDALQERADNIDQVEGKPGIIDGDRATAAAVLTTARAGEIRYECGLIRREGVWKISEWAEAR